MIVKIQPFVVFRGMAWRPVWRLHSYWLDRRFQRCRYRTIEFLRLASCLLAIGLLAGGVWLRAVPPGSSNPPKKETERRVRLGMAEPGSLYAVTVAIRNPAELQGNDKFTPPSPTRAEW